MGTKGASGLKKVVMGSNAAAVIDNSSVPVIAVPGQTEFKAIKKIVYASDMVNLSEEIKTIAMFASLFNASIHVLHDIDKDSAKKIDVKKTVSSLVRQTKYDNISFHVSKSDHVAEEVDAFVANQKADLLTMFTHKLDFYEKLFGRSVTRHLAFHVNVPLLTFNKTTLL
jgi:nucleotide-binding universal stress UspA family protein